MRLFRPFFPARLLYPDAIFRIKGSGRKLYLTFDDGPDPGSTPLLLKILGDHGIKAVFFCTASEAAKHPDLMNDIRASGHVTGNHGYDHINGFTRSLDEYLMNAEKGAAYTSQNLFRPPYGLLKISQYLALRKQYKIVFWDLMPYDFDRKFGHDNSLAILKKKIRPGSVIVLHDTAESSANLILEDFIKFAEKEGYDFGTI